VDSPKYGRIVIVAHRLNEDDLPGHLWVVAASVILRHIDRILARWVHRKFKSLRRHKRPFF
jgi:hypothetical protein